MTIEAIVQDLDKANAQLNDVRTRLIAERKQHEAAIKSIDAILASIPTPKITKPLKAPTIPVEPSAVQTGPTIGNEILTLAKAQPSITLAQLVDALPHRKRKSVENTVSRLTSAGALIREGKGYAAVLPVAAE